MTYQMLKNKHVKLSIEVILFYKTTLSAMKKLPHNRGGLSHDEDNFVAFGFIRGVASLEGGNLVVFYYRSPFEI